MKQMKFAIIILVAVVISILLGLVLSCFLAESESITTEQHIINTSVPVTTANTVEETTDELFDPVKYYDWYWYTNNYSISDVENPAFETIGEYYAFMDHFDQVLPQDMITYSCLEEIGDFEDFIMCGSGNFRDYSYGLHVKNDILLQIDIFHMSDGDSLDVGDHRKPIRLHIPSSDEDVTDMRTSDHRGVTVRLHNADFLYDTNGEIVHIITYISGYRITIQPRTVRDDNGRNKRCSLRGYDLSDKNFISLLLSGAEREDVEKAFLDMIS